MTPVHCICRSCHRGAHRLPSALVILGIVALAAAVYFNWNLIKTDTKDDLDADISNFITNIWTTIDNTVKTGINYVISAINGFINALDSIHINIPAITIPGTKLGTPAVNLGFNIPDIPMLAAGGFVTRADACPDRRSRARSGRAAFVRRGGAGGQQQQIVININGGIISSQMVQP